MMFAAASRCQVVWCAPWNVASPSCSVNASWFVRIVTSGQRKSFQVHMNWITASVASAGSDNGSDDPEQDRQTGGAVDPSGLLELDRQRAEELREHEDPEDAHEVRHDERAEVIDETRDPSRSGTWG